jgi:hypothetical protein
MSLANTCWCFLCLANMMFLESLLNLNRLWKFFLLVIMASPIGKLAGTLTIKMAVFRESIDNTVDTRLALLAHSNVPFKNWDDTFDTTSFLINRHPSIETRSKTPSGFFVQQETKL